MSSALLTPPPSISVESMDGGALSACSSACSDLSGRCSADGGDGTPRGGGSTPRSFLSRSRTRAIDANQPPLLQLSAGINGRLGLATSTILTITSTTLAYGRYEVPLEEIEQAVCAVLTLVHAPFVRATRSDGLPCRLARTGL